MKDVRRGTNNPRLFGAAFPIPGSTASSVTCTGDHAAPVVEQGYWQRLRLGTTYLERLQPINTTR